MDALQTVAGHFVATRVGRSIGCQAELVLK